MLKNTKSFNGTKIISIFFNLKFIQIYSGFIIY